jgi:hypothetical protein
LGRCGGKESGGDGSGKFGRERKKKKGSWNGRRRRERRGCGDGKFVDGEEKLTVGRWTGDMERRKGGGDGNGEIGKRMGGFGKNGRCECWKGREVRVIKNL